MSLNYPSLITNRLNLRAFTLFDVDELCSLAGDRRISDMCLNIPHPYLPETGSNWISDHSTAFNEKKAVIFAVCQKNGGKLVGACGMELEFSDKRGELGYWIGHPYQGNGYATEAVLETLRYGFTYLFLHRITATSISWNSSSAHVLEKAGFQKEGLLRRHVLKNGAFADLIMWGILRDEFADE
ncbi:GNAT family N-acetyltransferase [Methanospirillum stamsii]|uniref:N-acetyltransferase n=1 Tax=Methanospirillum stamsii TaxID=1277351 RepID=A0A2V2MRA7_9EURY|nr:GNAT family N-acetyltransferase [Methanospirillum stamsii]PWR70764.1 N-acetyltransferase [Methanospirillum stamsii]